MQDVFLGEYLQKNAKNFSQSPTFIWGNPFNFNVFLRNRFAFCCYKVVKQSILAKALKADLSHKELF